MKLFKEIKLAGERIAPYILKTPLLESKALGKLINGTVYLKMESEQYTGSFKARGSLNKLLSLSSEERQKGLVTASTGNHGLGFARAAEITESKGTVFLPSHASPSKLKALKQYDVQLEQYGKDSVETELYAKSMAAQNNKTWISPYNDAQVMAGQGTIGLELVEQLPDFDAVLVTVGGGGLIGGIGTYLKELRPKVKIVGCQPQNACEMALSLDVGKIVTMEEEKDTLSSGSAGGIEPNSITFPICQQVIDQMLLVTEDEITDGIRFMLEAYHKIVEGAAGVAIASLINNQEAFQGQTVVIVVCGANLDTDILKRIIE